MKIEHIFSSTNRQPKSIYWVPDESAIVTCATSSIILHLINSKHQHSCTVSKNNHKAYITSIGGSKTFFASGDISGSVLLWEYSQQDIKLIKEWPKCHNDPVNNIDVLVEDSYIAVASTAGDGCLQVSILCRNKYSLFTQQVQNKLPLYPLCCAIGHLPNMKSIFICVAYSDFCMRFYSLSEEFGESDKLVEQFTLTVGEDWITHLSLLSLPDQQRLKLAISNNDNLLRIISISDGSSSSADTSQFLDVEKSCNQETNLELKMETILQQHDKSVMASVWFFNYRNELELATCSMDKTVIIWKENENGVWEDYVRLGEVGGGNLGFLGLCTGKDVDGVRGLVAYSYTGSIRIWWNISDCIWSSAPAPSGHVSSVRGVAWSPNGQFLFSTSHDQTTRLYGKYINSNNKNVRQWAELGRPQIHGYSINCIGMKSNTSFISGAEEKVVRVFRAPRHFEKNFNTDEFQHFEDTPDKAELSALGLSNKAVYLNDKDTSDEAGEQFMNFGVKCAPKEEDLLQNTLWWEEKKLYGHGAELQAVAISGDSKWIASSCKATTLPQAAVIMWHTFNDCLEGSYTKLEGHSLTVTQIIFNESSNKMLTVGRDRIAIVWTLENNKWCKESSVGKEKNGHKRLIWNACWSKSEACVGSFYTVGRDCLLIKWNMQNVDWFRHASYTCNESITAVDSVAYASNIERLLIGTESGKLILINDDMMELTVTQSFYTISHASTVNDIKFKNPDCVATCSDDNQVKIFVFK